MVTLADDGIGQGSAIGAVVRMAAVSFQKPSNAEALALWSTEGLLGRRQGTDLHEVYDSARSRDSQTRFAQVFDTAERNAAEMSAAFTTKKRETEGRRCTALR